MDETLVTPPRGTGGPIVKLPVLIAFVVCAAVLALATFGGGLFYRVLVAPQFLLAHIVLEGLSIVVAYAVFAIGWYGYKQNRNTQDLYIAFIFLIVGAIDFAHTMSYQGMPDFITPNTVSKASTLWIAARLFAALSLLIAAFVPSDFKAWWMRPRPLLAAALVTAAGIIGVIVFFEPYLPPMFIPGQGQTPLKVGLEYGVIAMLAAAIFAFGKYSKRERSSVDLLQIALVISIFSELAFLLYESAFDTFNLLGHLFKVAAFYFILRALFVSSLQRPYSELIDAREELAGLVSETGELYEQADRQRERLERSFSQIGQALASSLEVRKTVGLVAELAAEMLGTEAALVAVPDPQLPVFNVVAGVGLAPEMKEIPMEDSLAGAAFRDKAPKWTGRIAEEEKLFKPELATGEVQSVLTAPLMFGDEVLGVLAVYAAHAHAFSREDAALLSTFAKQAAIAVDNARRYARERRIAQTFQRRLLPRLPELEEMDLAARYEPAFTTAEVGGDLYDALMLDTQRIALAIGDVSGKGLDAATIMASVQYMMRGFLFQGMQPGEVLASLHSALSKELDPNQFVTVFISILDVQTGDLAYANAGHPFPLLLTKTGCETMTGHNGGPVGTAGIGRRAEMEKRGEHWAISVERPYRTDRVVMKEPFGMIIYTDGLVEARRGDEFYGEERVLELCRQNKDKPSRELVDELFRSAQEFGEHGLTDDIAILVARWHPESMLD
ncbi:MAG: GAF domain-containing protein [Actinobacteria bacterium]|nr:MAG: GAF domain-containing protein [Actinomycetota bacterium]